MGAHPSELSVLLISTYELGRQPFGLASPAAWLRRDGFRVTCADLALSPFPHDAARRAHLVAFHLPMHTATRLAMPLIARVRALNPDAHICCYGLYASPNAQLLRSLGVGTLISGEFEPELLRLCNQLRLAECSVDERHSPAVGEPAGATTDSPRVDGPAGVTTDAPGVDKLAVVTTARQRFLVPDRSDLPALSEYAQLRKTDGTSVTVGYVEASRGCKHLCRHCPVVTVYGGQFRVVERDVVLEDIRRQVEAGAGHITFGDPDFFNGIGHAIPIIKALAAEFPQLTYDVTVKVEHLVRYEDRLDLLRETGCAFVTTAVEAGDDRVLELLDKGHTRADFVHVAQTFSRLGLTLNPTFVTFTPWTSPESYRDLLRLLFELDLVGSVAPVQLAIRLLIPAGSRLLELPEVQSVVGPFDAERLGYPWTHPDPNVDHLFERVFALVSHGVAEDQPREQIFSDVWHIAHEAADEPVPDLPDHAPAAVTVPYLTEPWYC